MNDGFDAVNIVTLIGVLLFSVGVHEAMHGYAAHWLGDDTAKENGRLTLNPIKHLDLYTSVLLPIILVLSHLPPFFAAKPVPFNPSRVKYEEFGSAIIGLAGPLTNLVLAILGSLVFRVVGLSSTGVVADVLTTFCLVNVALFVFNMIPFPPLDGSRLLYALAPEPIQNVMHQIETGGFMSIIVFMMIFIYTGLGSIITRIDYSILNFLFK